MKLTIILLALSITAFSQQAVTLEQNPNTAAQSSAAFSQDKALSSGTFDINSDKLAPTLKLTFTNVSGGALCEVDQKGDVVIHDKQECLKSIIKYAICDHLSIDKCEVLMKALLAVVYAKKPDEK